MRIRVVILAAFVVTLAGCAGGFAPEGPPGATDIGFMGCQVGPQPGATVREGNPLDPGQPMFGTGIEFMTPAQAGEAIRARGLKVTWRYQYGIDEPGEPGEAGLGEHGFSECWCQPPPDGAVSDFAYGMASEVVVFVDSQQRLPAPRQQPPRGWGC